jgi:hypothetical protein
MSGGPDGSGAAAALPAAVAARPAGGGSALHLADPAHRGGGGSGRADAADRGPAAGELAAPGWVSPGVERLRHPLPTPVPNRSGYTVGPAIAMHSYVGGRGRSIPEADPGRSSVTTAPDAPAAARRTAVLITRSEQEKLQ